MKCKICKNKLKDLGNLPSMNMNIIKDKSKICLNCGILHTNHTEELDEEVLDNYKEMFEVE